MRRKGLIGFPQIARTLGKSLPYVYQLHSADPVFPPVERQEGTRKLFARHAVQYYKRNCRRWYRPRAKGATS